MPSIPKREAEYYDLNDPFIDDEDLLVQEDDNDNPVDAFKAVAGCSDSEDESPASKIPTELPTLFQRLAHDLEKRVVALNLNPNNPGNPQSLHFLTTSGRPGPRRDTAITCGP